ncbi:FtsB family cell division protein [Bifidobacterium eulemuris]|nr:septum formation initiator family protein [Bifidobacterium eulemuris]QOL31501.1 septum formation initiator family protein [Bifidobacterium eulemuris]
MSKSTRTRSTGGKPARNNRGAGPIAFFVSLFIVALGTIQLVSTFHTYALNLAELNGLKREESSLLAQKQDLEDDIARWDDKAYVTAQARERLGFVFPGEQAVRVLHPEAVTGDTDDEDDTTSTSTSAEQNSLPWYSELAYSFEQADEPKDDASSGGTTTDSQNATSDTE